MTDNFYPFEKLRSRLKDSTYEGHFQYGKTSFLIFSNKCQVQPLVHALFIFDDLDILLKTFQTPQVREVCITLFSKQYFGITFLDKNHTQCYFHRPSSLDQLHVLLEDITHQFYNDLYPEEDLPHGVGCLQNCHDKVYMFYHDSNLYVCAPCISKYCIHRYMGFPDWKSLTPDIIALLEDELGCML